MTLAVYWLCAVVLLSCNALVQSEITTLYPTDQQQDWSLFPYGAGDKDIGDIKDYAADEDVPFGVEDLMKNINFFGTSYDRLFVYHRGYVKLGFSGAEYINLYKSYTDISEFIEFNPIFLSYQEYTTPEMLKRATDAVRAIRQYAIELPKFNATWILVVTWQDAVLHGANITDPLETNTFQLVLVCDDDAHTFAIFNYGHQMAWANNFFSEALVGIIVSGLTKFAPPVSGTDTINDVVRNKRMILRVDQPTFDGVPSCVPGTSSGSGNALFGPCNECPQGSFQPNSGSVNCTACLPGETTPNNGSLSAEDCYSECTDENCVTCDEDPDFCEQCVSGYIPNADGQCVADCPSGQFHCNFNGESVCIPDYYRCNGIPICDNDEDEISCEGQCSGYLCADGKCIHSDWYCDQVADCRDGEDEADCECYPGCVDCVNGVNFCTKCELGYYLLFDSVPICIECRPGCVKCSDGLGICIECKLGFGMVDDINSSTCHECLDQHCWKCDVDPDNCMLCEIGYSVDILTGKCVIITGCGSEGWECNDGQCIHEDYVCDTIPDCLDESDESDSQCGVGGITDILKKFLFTGDCIDCTISVG